MREDNKNQEALIQKQLKQIEDEHEGMKDLQTLSDYTQFSKIKVIVGPLEKKNPTDKEQGRPRQAANDEFEPIRETAKENNDLLTPILTRNFVDNLQSRSDALAMQPGKEELLLVEANSDGSNSSSPAKSGAQENEENEDQGDHQILKMKYLNKLININNQMSKMDQKQRKAIDNYRRVQGPARST